MDAMGWPDAFALVGVMACIAFAVATMVRGPRIIHVHHDDEDVEDE